MQHDSCTYGAIGRIDPFAETARITRRRDSATQQRVFFLRPVVTDSETTHLAEPPAPERDGRLLWARDPELRQQLRELYTVPSKGR